MELFKKYKNKYQESRLGQWCAQHRKKARALFIAGGAAFLLLIGTVTGCVFYFHSILPSDAEFCGVSLAGMNRKEVAVVLDNEINPRFADASIDFVFQQNVYPIPISEVTPYYQADDVFTAVKKCHYSKGEEPDARLCYNEDLFAQQLQTLLDTAKVPVTPSSYQQQGSTLLLTAGATGLTFDQEAAKQDILASAKSTEFTPVTAQEISLQDDTISINVDAVHNELAHTVQDASYTINDAGVLSYIDEVTGVDFDVEEAKRIVTDPNTGQYQVPLVITAPSVTVAQLKKEHDNASCPKQLSTYTTKYSTKDTGRVYNIQKAAATINGVVLYPGERFSFQGIVGPAGAAEGYRESTVYTSDGTDTGYGGGICQVSTTAYLAAIYGYFPITERHNHSYTVDYVPPGFDAAVSWGGPDLKFKNNRPNPVRIVATTGTGSITVSIYGTPSEYDQYDVTMTSTVLSTTPAPVEQISTADLPQGTQRVKTKGQDGCTANAHKVVTRNGKVVETQDIKSNYKTITKVIEVGTGATPTPTPAPTPEPTPEPSNPEPPPEPDPEPTPDPAEDDT